MIHFVQKSNVYSSVQRRKMRTFCEYQRKAIVVIPADEEYNQRLSAHNAIEGNVSESDLKEMKGIHIFLALYLIIQLIQKTI